MLAVSGIDVAFEGTCAVDGVSFELAKGEVVAVLGPSGSGKSTLLRAVAGLQRPDAGAVTIDGVDASRAAPHERGVGFMFQTPSLFPHRDVAGNVGFGLRMAGVDAATRRTRVAELLELVGLPGTESRSVSTLSGGEAQRVALARALAPAPQILLLDEPFGALDAVLRARLVEDVGQLVRRLGLTVLAVTHDREEAYALADRVLVMRAGRIVGDGTPESLWAEPGDAWVASFLGMPNVLPAHVVGGTARTALGTLVVRPEAHGSHVVVPAAAVHVARPGEPVVGAGCFEARVVARTFLGDRVRLVVRVDPASGEAPVDLVAVVPVADAASIDATVRVRIDPAAVLVLP